MGNADKFLKQAKLKRSLALARSELRQPTEPRVSASSPTSFPVKAVDPDVTRMVEDFMRRR